MICNISFDNAALTGLLGGTPATNGVWDYLGYSTTETGTYVTNADFAASYTYGAVVDASGKPEGFYKFLYKSTLPASDPCYGEIEVILPIVQGTGDMPADKSVSFCSGDGVVNLANEFNPTPIPTSSGVLPVVTAISGTLTGVAGYSNGGTATDETDDTLDTSVGPYPVSGTWVVTKTPVAPTGYTLSGCDNCLPASSTLTVSVTEAFDAGTLSKIAVCSDS